MSVCLGFTQACGQFQSCKSISNRVTHNNHRSRGGYLFIDLWTIHLVNVRLPLTFPVYRTSMDSPGSKVVWSWGGKRARPSVKDFPSLETTLTDRQLKTLCSLTILSSFWYWNPISGQRAALIPGAVIVPNSCGDYCVDENVRGTGRLKWSHYCGVSPTNDSGKLFTDNILLCRHHPLHFTLKTLQPHDDFSSLYFCYEEVSEDY